MRKDKIAVAEADYARRLERVRARLEDERLDGLLVASADNRRYLTGFTAVESNFTESAGWVLVTPRLLALIGGTGAISGLEAEIEPSGTQILLTDQKLPWEVLAETARAQGMRRLGFERDWLNYRRFERLAQVFSGGEIEVVPTDDLVLLVRARKDAAEIATIRRAADIANRAFAALLPEISLGMTERQVAVLLERILVDLGASGPSFETLVACGAGGEQPHATPRDRELRAGEPLLIDFGCRVDGYCSDLTRTICIGEPSPRLVEVYGIVRAAQDAAMDALRAGARRGREVDAAAREVITRAGYGERFLHALGHGIGLSVHELPMFGWLRVATPEMDEELRRVEHLAPGNVVSNEPGVYLPGWGGVRLEDMLLLTEDGAESFTERNPERIITLAG